MDDLQIDYAYASNNRRPDIKFWARKTPGHGGVLVGASAAVAAEVVLTDGQAEQLRDWLTEYLTGQLIASHQPGNSPKPKTDTGVND